MALPKDKKKKVKGTDPSKYIELEPTLDEAAKGTAVISFGRMNPVTIGHEKLVKKVIDIAKKEKGVPLIFLTHSFDKKKNPLAYEDKIKFAQKAFGPVVQRSNAKTIMQLLAQLQRTYNRVIFVAGSDRVSDFDSLLNKYNGKDYNFDEIKVVSAGQRDPDSDDVSGISGTKLRGYASSDIQKFIANLPSKLKANGEEIAALVRKGMGMSESEEIHIDEMEPLDEVLDRQARRKKSLQMKKFRYKMARGREKAKKRTATLDVLKKRARKDAINMLKKKFSKNRRYAELSFAEKELIDKRIAKISKQRIETLAKKLLPKTKQRERDRKLAMAKGGASKNESLNTRFEAFLEEKTGAYYKGVDKDKKDARAAHFERGKKMDDNNPAAYKPAPGDKEAKTKESKHTKKFRQMYGESLHEMWGSYVTKKPHMLLDKNGKTKFDGRFKMYKKKPHMVEDTEDLIEELMDLIESTEAFIELEENSKEGLKKKAEKSGMPYGILKKVYDRGVAAWRTGHRPGTTPEQWGYARVNSFVTKSSGTWGKADKDLASKVRKEEAGAGEEGTDKLVNKYKKDTPSA